MWSNGCMDEVDMVRHYLRGQNLEQLGREPEAIQAYEVAVEGRFDSAGPYDRLIDLYGRQALHRDVVRVAGAALENVRTYSDKRDWYEKVRTEAAAAAGDVPRAAPKKTR